MNVSIITLKVALRAQLEPLADLTARRDVLVERAIDYMCGVNGRTKAEIDLDTEEETQLSIEIGAIQAAALDLGRAIRILKAAAKFNK